MGRSGARISMTAIAVLAFATPFLYHLVSQYVSAVLEPVFQSLATWSSSPSALSKTTTENSSSAVHKSPQNGTSLSAPFVCDPLHSYTTEIISLEPLLIYITDFLSPDEITALLAAGEPEFAPSEVIKPNTNHKQATPDRTSQSAGLPADDAAVACVLARAEKFMGPLLDRSEGGGPDEIGPPQLVRYTEGQRFNIHHDWYERPQPARREQWARFGVRGWNRLASFFAVLQDECTGGETHFPYVEPLNGRKGRIAGRRDGNSSYSAAAWYERDGGGVAFRPVKGNALFWVNLHANGTGDERTMHAGLPLGEGLKTAMNIWPRKYYW